ncbi:MAG: zinc metalloprotease HtpX [Thermoplasmata archaeon]
MRYIAKTMGLFFALALLFVGIGYLIGGLFMGDWIMGSLIFLILAVVMNIGVYFFSDKIILRMYNAKIIEEHENPRLYNLVKDIAYKADMPMPKVAIVPMEVPNAFATGRNEKSAVVAATQGILHRLNDNELKGVMAHEMAHIKNRDMLVMSIAATIAGAIALMARLVWFQMIFSRRRINPIFLVAMILAPIGAIMVKMAISRKREYYADEEGAKISRNPNALADALEKLHSDIKRNPLKKGDPATSSLFIVNPFKSSGFVKLFSTHPPMEERVKRLRKMATDYSYL